MSTALVKAMPSAAPGSPAALHAFVRRWLNADVARAPVVPGSTAPFDYLCHTFFEGTAFGRDGEALPEAERHDPDAVVWASRGGGKTFLAAVATLLDVIYKPGIEIHLLAGSIEQGRRMHQHLRRLLERPGVAELVEGKFTSRSVRLTNGSRVELLAQSETSVRGCRVQKLRCDEVELFDREVWEAAQLVTRSVELAGPWGKEVRGAVEALSTMHRPFGLMWEITEDAERALLERSAEVAAREVRREASPGPAAEDADADADAADPERARRLAAAGASSPRHVEGVRRRRIFKWGVIDVLEACDFYRQCDGCAIWTECRGIAKKAGVSNGHFRVADAVQLKSRVSTETWESEMLCKRPSRSDSVFPEFSPERHVFGDGAPLVEGDWVMGMDFGFRAPTVMLLGCAGRDGVLRVVEERVEAGRTVEEHVASIEALGWPRPAWIGIDPAGLQVNDQTGRSAKEVIERAGHRVRWRPSEIHNGLMAVRARLRPADGGPPRLLIHRRCQDLISALVRYHYDLDRPSSLNPVKDGPDHAADALRYLVTNLDRAGARRRFY